MRPALVPFAIATLLAAGPALAGDPCRPSDGGAIGASLPAVWARMPVIAVERDGQNTRLVLAVDSVASARLLQARSTEPLSGDLVERGGRIAIVCAAAEPLRQAARAGG